MGDGGGRVFELQMMGFLDDAQRYNGLQIRLSDGSLQLVTDSGSRG